MLTKHAVHAISAGYRAFDRYEKLRSRLSRRVNASPTCRGLTLRVALFDDRGTMVSHVDRPIAATAIKQPAFGTHLTSIDGKTVMLDYNGAVWRREVGA